MDLGSILGSIVVLHNDIGEATRNRRSHFKPLNNVIFFSNLDYVPPTIGILYGFVESLLLLAFADSEWLLEDMHTNETFRFKLCQDF